MRTAIDHSIEQLMNEINIYPRKKVKELIKVSNYYPLSIVKQIFMYLLSCYNVSNVIYGPLYYQQNNYKNL